MILGFHWAVLLAWLLAAFFVVDGIVNFIGPKSMKEGFVRWGFPSWWNYVNGAVQVVAGLLIAFEATRVWGIALALLLCVAIWATLIRHKDYAHLPPSIGLAVILVVAYWGGTTIG